MTLPLTMAPPLTVPSAANLPHAAATEPPLATYPAPARQVDDHFEAGRYLEHDAERLRAAVDFAARAHEGQRRKSGEPYIIHPLATARILADLRLDADTIVAGLLHDVVEDTDITLDRICDEFGESVSMIVAGVTDEEPAKQEAADKAAVAKVQQRELLLAMSAEWRVVLVKLADRLHNMRTLEHMPRLKQMKKAKETLELFVPLARRIGARELEAELQRLSAQYLFPRAATLVTPALLTPLAKMQCPDLLDDFLDSDEHLSASDVDFRLSCHRERWAAHCARLHEYE